MSLIASRTKVKKSLPPKTSRVVPVLAQPDAPTVITPKQRDQILYETAMKQAELPELIITKSSVSLYSWEDMQKIAGPIRVTNASISGNGSVNDPRMGEVSLNISCQYCGQIDCPGHYGLIEFRCMIYNPAYIRDVLSVLTCICNDCGGLLITEDVMRQQKMMRLKYDKRLAAMEAYCGNHECLRQKPKIGGGKVSACAKNPTFITTDLSEKGEISFVVLEKGKKRTPSDPVYVLSINTAYSIIDKISVKDAYLLGFTSYHRYSTNEASLRVLDKADPNLLDRLKIKNHRSAPYSETEKVLDSLPEQSLRELGYYRGNHPRNMIMRGMLVPPVIARPPVYEAGSIHHDQLTHMYITVMRRVQEVIQTDASTIELYTAVKQLVFKTDGKKMGTKEYLSIVERIQGKSALLRGLLMGKRNNYCGRTVAGPDPTLRFGQIRVPEVWAPILTKKITVTDFNIEEVEYLMREGKVTHVTPKATGLRRFYSSKNKYGPRVGDVIERWLQNGDRIVNNRQPTLHRQSMMGYEVVLGYQLTIGLHLSYTTPMNCDFDGDENNVWNPQDFEVEAEVDILMNVKNNIMSSEQNRPIMGLVMNSISGAYLLTDKTTKVDPLLIEELMSLIGDERVVRSLPSRLDKYGVDRTSGAAVFSALLPEDFYYDRKGVKILEGVLISGQIKKAHVGSSHRSIIQELHKKYGPERTSDFFTEAPWLINKWIIERGFTVGMMDVINLATDEKTGEEYDKNKRILDQELAKIYVQLQALGGKLQDPMEEFHRQRQINNLVNIAQGIGLRLAKEVLKGDNAIGVMTDQGAGTKGGLANIGQIMGSVGQQYYRGERLKPTLSGERRLLPTYDLDDNSPESNAFIPQSFFTGLTPEGLFFLQAGGREGLLDTALKTSDTGSMQRKMMKAFENILVAYDGSVRNTIGTLFSPVYNSGYDVAEMIAVDSIGKTNFSSFIDLSAVAFELNAKRGWVDDSTRKIVQEKRSLPIPPMKKIEEIDIPEKNYTLKITKFEKARIIGSRARQLSNNDLPYIETDEIDPIRIATAEYYEGLIPIYVIRKQPDGSYQKVFPTLDMI